MIEPTVWLIHHMVVPHGSVAQAFMRERNLQLPVEVEASSIAQVQELLDLLASEPRCMVSRIMLDNMARLDPSAPGAPP